MGPGVAQECVDTKDGPYRSIACMWSAYFSIDYKDVAAFSILAITLIFLPQGLLGRPEVEKV